MLRFLILLLVVSPVAADWPMLRGSATHAGFVAEPLADELTLQWAVEFENERIGTAVEPVVAGDRVFIGTHAGVVHALDLATGKELWRFPGLAPFLHSPAVASGLVIAAAADGYIYGLEAARGVVKWRHSGPQGGYSAAPIVAEGRVLIGSRSGEMLALDLQGAPVWSQQLLAPIRQTAAFHKGRLYVTAEDLRLRCFDPAGKLLWTSKAMLGQTARDYYPVVVEREGRAWVAVRTNPLQTMSRRIGEDRTMLARTAGFDDSGWEKVEAWIKAGRRGMPELWEKEQKAAIDFLKQTPDAESFYLFDAATGQAGDPAPVLWASGCQSAGAPPASTSEGRMLVLYRSAYGNWNHGVAPLVALGLLEPAKNRIAPLHHETGAQPPWNTFWGTADESQNFLVAGQTALIVHQGTLSGFDLAKNRLFKIHGERDTYGGFANPPWARNEWHGPARAGVAVSNGRVSWQTGSRILCLAGQKPGEAKVTTISFRPEGEPPPRIKRIRTRAEVRAELNRVAAEILSARWAPLFVDPGLSGREFVFDESTDLFAAFAEARRFLTPELQAKAAEVLGAELREHPPFAPEGRYDLKEGAAREWFTVPAAFRTRTGTDRRPHPFGGLWAAVAWDGQSVRGQLPVIVKAYENWKGWTFDPAKGDLHANRYYRSLAALAGLAEEPLQTEVRKRAEALNEQIVKWWKNAAAAGSLRQFKGSGELDPFINRGDLISFKVAPHRHRIALFRDLEQNIFRDVLEEEPEAASEVWNAFTALHATWPLQGEERQVHFGENFVDTPELALGAFKVMGWLGENSPEELNAALDLPACRADLYYLHKLALVLAAP